MTYICMVCDNVWDEYDLHFDNGIPKCPECKSEDIVETQEVE